MDGKMTPNFVDTKYHDLNEAALKSDGSLIAKFFQATDQFLKVFINFETTLACKNKQK